MIIPEIEFAATPTAPGPALLPVMEHFYTLQGEGAYAGHAAYFIRLGGCDVGCHWCDVKESWPMEGHPLFSLDDLQALVLATPARLVVITGGEPFMHNLEEMCGRFSAAAIRLHVETSGAHPLTGQWDWITLSPKKFKPARPEYYAHAHELKMVIYHPSDLKWAEEHRARVTAKGCAFYLQPEWDRRERIEPLLVDYVKQNPHWRLSLQTHKYLGIE